MLWPVVEVPQNALLNYSKFYVYSVKFFSGNSVSNAGDAIFFYRKCRQAFRNFT